MSSKDNQYNKSIKLLLHKECIQETAETRVLTATKTMFPSITARSLTVQNLSWNLSLYFGLTLSQALGCVLLELFMHSAWTSHMYDKGFGALALGLQK